MWGLAAKREGAYCTTLYMFGPPFVRRLQATMKQSILDLRRCVHVRLPLQRARLELQPVPMWRDLKRGALRDVPTRPVMPTALARLVRVERERA